MSSLCSNGSHCSDHSVELRRGPWTAEEDNLLIHYVACHGEGRWNMLANCSGLRRTGKSCRLRWLNYLKPDIKHGNLSPEEQLLILKLHTKLGNRWSKIAKYLPGRTDNEIKNYWRTKVEKQARHLKLDSNSKAFQEMIRCLWIPRLLQKMQISYKGSSATPFQGTPADIWLTTPQIPGDCKSNQTEPSLIPLDGVGYIPGDGTSEIIESATATASDHQQMNCLENGSSTESGYINQVLISSNSGNPLSETDYNQFQEYNLDQISYDLGICSPGPFTEISNFQRF